MQNTLVGKNYIFSRRNLSKPSRKLFGESEYKTQIIERDNRIYTVWDKTMKNSYFLFYCYETIELKSKLKSFKNIK